MTFIALEGGEGVGKTTQKKLLEQSLPQCFPDRTLVFTREPGGTPFAELIRGLILCDEAHEADGLTMFGLFSAARADHVRSLIRPKLEAGHVVVSDRFAGSSFAYQAYAQESPIPIELFRAHCHSIGVMPDLTIIFDMDPKAALNRIPERADVENHFDAREMDFHLRLREGYERYAEFAASEGHRVDVVDASRSPEDVHERVMRSIASVL